MKAERDLRRELTGVRETGPVPPAPDAEAIRRLVFAQLNSAEKGRNMTMRKHMNWKTLLVAAAAALALSISAFAAGSAVVRINSTSRGGAEYRSLPTEQACLRDAGYAPILAEGFENGYTFREGNLVYSSLEGEDGSILERYRAFDFTYEKDGNTVILEQAKYSSTLNLIQAPYRTVDGVTLFYQSSLHRVVPPDYEPTEEEQAAVAAGTLSFGYSEDAAEQESTVQTLSWQIGDMHYTLYQLDGALSPEALAEMAAELIRK